MIGMSNWLRNGRSGNALFQWAFLSSLSRAKNVPYVLPKWEHAHLFKGQIPVGEINGHKIKERSYTYSDYSDLDYSLDLDYTGHYQSELYFDDKVKEEIQFTDRFKSEVRSKFALLLRRKTISIGVRRTDYLTLPYYQLSANYYISALEKHFPDWRECNLIFISDDLQWCKFHFGCLDNAYFPETRDMEQMCLSSLCDHFIIANSTFHWWAAFMGEKEGTKVVQPTKLFIGSLLEKHGDVNFYSDRWVKHDEQPVDLKDLTFTIPVFCDSNDRKENLELTVCLIQKNFNTNIIIGEQGTDKLQIPNCEYVKFDYPNFHRTKMLNEMAKMARTPYIANWDCDVFTPPMQILESVHKLRQGQQMVYPYEWDFVRVMRKERPKIFPWYDLGVYTNYEYRTDDKPQRPSLGGAVLWNKQKFFEIGGENEYFISFGPEDVERWDRARILGVNIERVKGKLYHFNHWCGPDSSISNPHFKANRRLHHEIAAKSQEEMKVYVESLPWLHRYTSDWYDEINESSEKSGKAIYEAFFKVFGKKQRIVDVGCGTGAFSKGVGAYGVDFQVPADMVVIENHREYDLTSSEPFPFDGRFDLVTSVEVGEHLPPPFAEQYVNLLCSLGDTILFSAAVENQGGNGHYNERPQSYWAGLFAKNGLYPSLNDFRKEVWDNPDVRHWYKSGLVVYQKKMGFNYLLDIVHPDLLKSKCQ